MTKTNDTSETTAETSPVPAKPQKTTAEKIWADIAKREINMFALPHQTVEKYCSPVFVEPTRCYVKFTVSSVIQPLQDALSKKYDVELVDKYITISPKPPESK